MFIFLTIIILIAAVLLVAIVVIQNSKGGGLASGFATGNSMMGVRKTTDFLEKPLGGLLVLSLYSVLHLQHLFLVQKAKKRVALSKV